LNDVSTYRQIAENVRRKIKFVNISREERSTDVLRALELLALSRVVHPVVQTSANGRPLGAGRDERHFEALFLEIGLMNRLCVLEPVEAEELITVPAPDGRRSERPGRRAYKRDSLALATSVPARLGAIS